MTENETSSVPKVDTLGAVASSLCAAHCASAAIAPSLLVALGLGAAVGPAFEWGFTGLAVAMAAVSVLLGWRRHRTRWIATLLIGGIIGLIVGRLVEVAGLHELGTAIAVSSGLALVVGHLAGLRVTPRAA